MALEPIKSVEEGNLAGESGIVSARTRGKCMLLSPIISDRNRSLQLSPIEPPFTELILRAMVVQAVLTLILATA